MAAPKEDLHAIRHACSPPRSSGSASAGAASAATWTLDPSHTSVQFSVRHMMVSNVRGEFTKVSGTVEGDEAAPTEAVIEVTIDAASIDTRDAEARRASARRGLLRRREVSDDHLQVEEDRGGRRRRVQGDRRPHAARRHQGGRARRVRRDARHQGSVRQDASRRPRHHEAQPQGLRHQLEQDHGRRRASWWATRWRSRSTSRPSSSDRRPHADPRRRRPAHAARRRARAGARAGGDDGGGGARRRPTMPARDDALLARIDSLAVVNVFCWPYANAPRLLAERLGVHPAEELYTTVGGNTPQWLVNETAAAHRRRSSARGAPRRRGGGAQRDAGAQGAGARSTGAAATDRRRWSARQATAPARTRSRRASCCRRRSIRCSRTRSGPAPAASIAEHQRHAGRALRRLSAVAAENPHAWFRQARTRRRDRDRHAVEPDDRLPVPEADERHHRGRPGGGGADDVRRPRPARSAFPRDRWVYLRGSGEAHDRWFVSERVDYTELAGHPRGGPSGARRRRDRHRAASTTSTSTAASRPPCRSAATCSASPPTIRGRSRSPAACRTSAGPATTTRMHAHRRDRWTRVRARPGLDRARHRARLVRDQARGRHLLPATPKDGPFVREDPAPRQALLDAAAGARAGARAVGPARPSRPTPCCTIATARRCAGSSSAGLDDGRRFLADTPGRSRRARRASRRTRPSAGAAGSRSRTAPPASIRADSRAARHRQFTVAPLRWSVHEGLIPGGPGNVTSAHRPVVANGGSSTTVTFTGRCAAGGTPETAALALDGQGDLSRHRGDALDLDRRDPALAAEPPAADVASQPW